MGKIWPRAEPATRPGRKEAMRAPQTPDLPRSGPDPLPHKDTRMITRTLAAAIAAVPRSTGSLIHWLAIRATTARLPLHPRGQAAAGADWQSNPLTQVRWGIGSLNTTYGSPCAAWAHWQAGGSY